MKWYIVFFTKLLHGILRDAQVFFFEFKSFVYLPLFSIMFSTLQAAKMI